VALDIDGKRLTVYFSEDGLSTENDDPALNEVVKKIAMTLDAELRTPRRQVWIAKEHLDYQK